VAIMAAVRIAGAEIAAEIRQQLVRDAEDLGKKGITPGMSLILVGHAEDSAMYVRIKARVCESVGGLAETHHLDGDITIRQLMTLVDRLNRDDSVHGVLVQLPLPYRLRQYERQVMSAILPEKDIDAVHPVNIGNLLSGGSCYRGPAANACIKILEHLKVDFKGKHAVVVGRSIEIGKPVAAMLCEKGCTVTLVSPDVDFAPYTRQGDIVVAETGRPQSIDGYMLKPGAIVIDTGSNRVDDKMVGDVDYDSAAAVAAAITPVPGGVGPVRVIMLVKNLLIAASSRLERGVLLK
jgi:methylenetetrahydrofolate dehydrogenase (NADP+)/methenyltetrahydrofolate cyclohydrolase